MCRSRYPNRLHRCFVTGCLLLVGVAPLDATELLPVGTEFQVNTRTANQQAYPAVSLDADGDFVVVWTGYGQDDPSAEATARGVFGKRFSSAGVPQAAEFQVNAYTPGSQSAPSLSLDAGGDFVVAWIDFAGHDGSEFGVFARRFNSTGVPQAAEFQVNSYTPSRQTMPSVALDADGDFVIAWSSHAGGASAYDVFLRRFSAAGIAQAAELQINAYTTGSQSLPSVSLDADGDFVVAWANYAGQDGSLHGVFARRFSSAGVPRGAEFQVNAYTTGDQSVPSVSLDGDGDFVVAWNSIGQDGSGFGVFARRFASSGIPQAAEFQVSAYTSSFQFGPTVALDPDGDFVVAWSSYQQDGSLHGVFARRFSASGVPQAAELQVNSYTSDSQAAADVSLSDSGDVVVAWQSTDQDGSDNGVFAQRFQSLAVLDIDGNGKTAALTDGLLVLRYLFGFTGATLVTGAIAADCSRCNAAAVQAYLQTLI
jgi:phosphoheptose isomerase